MTTLPLPSAEPDFCIHAGAELSAAPNRPLFASALGQMRARATAAAGDCFARRDVAELTIGMATIRYSARSGVA
jgi:hypothetical protein